MDQNDRLMSTVPVFNDDVDVKQSEAVRRLWEIVNERLDLFDAGDPFVRELFRELQDEVENFCKLPEEDILDFQKGIRPY